MKKILTLVQIFKDLFWLFCEWFIPLKLWEKAMAITAGIIFLSMFHVELSWWWKGPIMYISLFGPAAWFLFGKWISDAPESDE